VALGGAHAEWEDEEDERGSRASDDECGDGALTVSGAALPVIGARPLLFRLAAAHVDFRVPFEGGARVSGGMTMDSAEAAA